MAQLEHITSEQIEQYGVVSAPDRLTGKAIDNKKIFDRLISELVAKTVNSIIDQINKQTNDLKDKATIYYPLESGSDANMLTKFGAYRWTLSNYPANVPEQTSGVLFFYGDSDTTTTAAQMVIFSNGHIYTRWMFSGSNWGNWVEIATIKELNSYVENISMLPKSVPADFIVDGELDLNSVIAQGHYVLDTSWTLLNAPTDFAPTGLIVERFKSGSSSIFVRQTAVRITSDSRKYAIRISGVDGVWQSWFTYEETNAIRSESLLPKNVPNNLVVGNLFDFNNLVMQGHYAIDTSWSLANAPSGFVPTGLIVERFKSGESAIFVRQTALKITSGAPNIFFIRYSNVRGEWSDWAEIEQRQDVNYYNTYKTEQYNNSYTVTATPSITTDTLYFLAAPVDGHDVTEEIETMLNTYGVCRLGVGTYNVTGIDMPKNTHLSGLGNKTIIRLFDSVTSGYAVKLREKCTVRDMTVLGSDSGIVVSETVGTRHGFMWEGDANADTPVDIPYYGTITNCHIENFNGGGITCYNTGYATGACVMVSDCYIVKCSAGINISYFSEFHRFTNVTCRLCWYGCINNGGNNVFTACNFSTNKMGILFDNSKDQSPNNTHGSMVGCLLNHADSNKGTAIRMLNCKNGYTFTGCQIWYGKIELVDSEGVIFADGIFRGDEYTITRGGSIIFANCQFSQKPSFKVSENTLVKAVNCYLKSTGNLVEI